MSTIQLYFTRCLIIILYYYWTIVTRRWNRLLVLHPIYNTIVLHMRIAILLLLLLFHGELGFFFFLTNSLLYVTVSIHRNDLIFIIIWEIYDVNSRRKIIWRSLFKALSHIFKIYYIRPSYSAASLEKCRGIRRSPGQRLMFTGEIGLVLSPGNQTYLFERYLCTTKTRKIIRCLKNNNKYKWLYLIVDDPNF